MSMERFPKHIIDEKYNYGFALGLMKKDVDVAMKLIKEPLLLKDIHKILDEMIHIYGSDADYTEVTKKYFVVN